MREGQKSAVRTLLSPPCANRRAFTGGAAVEAESAIDTSTDMFAPPKRAAFNPSSPLAVAGTLGWDPRLSWLYPYIQKTQQKRKGGQIRFTNEQTDALEHKFDSHKYLSPQERKKLAKSLSLSERQVRVSSLVQPLRSGPG